MPPTFRIEPTDRIPDGARVCHYDELEESAKERFPALVGSTDSIATDAALESTAEACDLVKFTDYYRIGQV